MKGWRSGDETGEPTTNDRLCLGDDPVDADRPNPVLVEQPVGCFQDSLAGFGNLSCASHADSIQTCLFLSRCGFDRFPTVTHPTSGPQDRPLESANDYLAVYARDVRRLCFIRPLTTPAGEDVAGSMLRFAEAPGSADPRPSIQERYGDRAGWLRRLERVCTGMVEEGWLLQEDADRLVAAARAGQDPFPVL